MRQTYDLSEDCSQDSRRRRSASGKAWYTRIGCRASFSKLLLLGSTFKRKKNENDANHRTEVEISREARKKGLFFFLKGMWGGVGWVGKRKGILNGILFPELYQLANISYKRNKDTEKEFHALKSPQSAANAPGCSYKPFIPTAPSPSWAITSVQVHPGVYCHADEAGFSHCLGRHSHRGLALGLIQAGLNCPGE